MRHRPVTLLVLACALACAPTPKGEARPRKDPTLMTAADLAEHRFPNVYDAIAALHPTWMQTRGTDSFSTPSAVVVYLDAVRLGGIESLRTIQISDVGFIRHLDGIAATGRYGMGHAAGVILITPFRSKAPPPPTSASHAHGPQLSEEQGAPEPPSSEGLATAPSPFEPVAIVPARAAYVTAERAANRFPLAESGRTAPIYASADDHAGVLRALGDLCTDLGRVTGREPPRYSTDAPIGRGVVLVGTIGHSEIIDGLIRSHRFDAAGLAGKWEAFATQIVDEPMPGVARALVIAGSDKRGTIYGIYDLSSQIGVSPWHWWADVPVPVHPSLYVTPGRHTQGEPAVKYRGIFINDEAPAFSGWTREKFGGVNHAMYEHMFELILRMKGNYLWPAMWGNAFADDDSLNAIRADEFGIVMGTSHHEPLTRAQQEWKRYGRGEWNYEKNDSTLRAFWRKGIERMGTRENIVTVGMRGDGDMPMTEGSNIALLERIVADQRTIIADVTHKSAAATPQLWALYKEVQDYYDKGMRVPDDVTLLFSDDNWGNLRRLPTGNDRARSGGFGLYYHFDYVGGPRNYKWLNTNPIARVWEQLNLAYTSGTDRIWIVNVGDLKPMEYPIQFFLDYAWNPKAVPASQLPTYGTQWAAQQFGAEHAIAIGNIMRETLKFNARRKPELLDVDTYSLVNFGESDTVNAAYAALVSRADSLANLIPATQHDAFYELVQHPVHAAADLNALYATVARNRMYAQQGRAATNALADRARQLFERDAEISREYNTQLAGGKWNHMMDQTHIGYTYWQEPPRNTMPRVDVIQLPVAADMGVAVVEVNRAASLPRTGMPAGGPPPGGAARQLALPPFDPFLQQQYHVDVYNRGQTAFDMTAKTDAPWLTVAPWSARVTTEQRLTISVDWSKVPAGSTPATVIIAGPNGTTSTVRVLVIYPASPRRDDVRGFVASNGIVAMEAMHFARAVNDADATWEVIPGLGRTLAGVHAMPASAPGREPSGNSARLEYDVTVFDTGSVTIHAYLSPSLNVSGARTGLRYAVSIDDDVPQVVNITADSSNATWEKSVADNIKVLTTRHHLARSGAHVLKFWRVDPGVVLQKLVLASTELPLSYLGPPESFHRDAATGARK